MRRGGSGAALLALLLCLLLCLPLTTGARADFGSYAGDTDYGDSSDPGGGGSYSHDDDDDDGDSTLCGYLAAIILILLGLAVRGIYLLIKRGLRRLFGKGAKPEGARRTAGSRLRPMGDLSVTDESFDPAALKARLSNLYVQMQGCWTDRQLAPLRPYLTDALYAQMERQVASMKKQGRTNYVERIAVLGVELRGFLLTGGEEHLIAEVRARIVDYTLDDRTGKCVSGSRKKEKFMTYEWELTRPQGTVTRPAGQLTTVNCPNCNAPVSLNQSAKCPYCGSVIQLRDHDWAVSAIRGISQRTGK